jgi:hypothetical protein
LFEKLNSMIAEKKKSPWSFKPWGIFRV